MADNTAKTKKPKKESTQDEYPLKVSIVSPWGNNLEEKASSVSAHNKSGPFDILDGHANFICLLEPGEMKVVTPYEERTFKIAQGILKVQNNEVTVFIDV